MTGGIIQGGFDHVDVNFFAVGGLVFLDGLEGTPAAHDVLVVLLVLGCEVGRKKIEVRVTENLVARFAQRLAEARVGEGELLLQVLAEDILRKGFHQRMVESLGVAEVDLGAFALGTSLDGALVEHDAFLSITHGTNVLGDPDDDAVLAVDPRLKAADHIALLHELDEVGTT